MRNNKISRFFTRASHRWHDVRGHRWSGELVDRLKPLKAKYCQHLHLSEMAASTCARKMLTHNAAHEPTATDKQGD